MNPHNFAIEGLVCHSDTGGVLGPVDLVVVVNSSQVPAVVSAFGHALPFGPIINSGIAE